MLISEVISRKTRKALRQKRAGQTSTDDPYLLGDEARHNGKLERDNPFAEETEDYIDWQTGWREAKVT